MCCWRGCTRCVDWSDDANKCCSCHEYMCVQHRDDSVVHGNMCRIYTEGRTVCLECRRSCEGCFRSVCSASLASCHSCSSCLCKDCATGTTSADDCIGWRHDGLICKSLRCRVCCETMPKDEASRCCTCFEFVCCTCFESHIGRCS